MANIILCTGKLKVYEDLKYLCEFTGKGDDFRDSLWEALSNWEELYDEFAYYIDNHALKDQLSILGYSLTDLYIHMIENYNLLNDTGKNTFLCNKEAMVLESFMGMWKLKENPQEYVKKLEAGRGMDLL
ncbi:MAG: hypothetical protein MJ123_01220 [Lachnospiraceae bacterium]|nr:hypothetical protein [Lachnospiraceae bacterium]